MKTNAMSFGVGWEGVDGVAGVHRALEYRKTENVSKFRINFFSYHLIVSVETKHETRFQRCNFVSHLLMEFSRSFSLWFAFYKNKKLIAVHFGQKKLTVTCSLPCRFKKCRPFFPQHAALEVTAHES